MAQMTDIQKKAKEYGIPPWLLDSYQKDPSLLDKLKAGLGDVYGFGQTAFKGANQAASKILSTVGNVLESTSPQTIG